MIKIKMTYKDLHEKEKAINELKKIFIVRNVSKEYIRAKGNDVYVDVDIKNVIIN